MTYQEIFLRILSEKWFDEIKIAVGAGYPVDPATKLFYEAGFEAYEEFKRQELPDCICQAHAEEKKTSQEYILDALAGEVLAPKGEEKKEEPERWRALQGETYYFLGDIDNENKYAFIEVWDDRDKEDNRRYEAGNYFPTRAAALEKLEAVRQILKQ